MGVVRGIALPSRAEIELEVDGEGAEGCVLPGLVDMHSHPGMESPGDVYSHEVFRRHMVAHRDAGVLTVRSPGSPDPVIDRPDDADLPRLVRSGRWLATPGRFFPDYGRRIEESELPAAAVEEAAAGWCKIIGDWDPDAPPVPLDVLTETVAAVHEAGGRVAVHCQTAAGCRNAVLAGADSLEHGMHLDPALLPRMAAQGTAFVPTMTTFGQWVASAETKPDGPRKDWVLSGWHGYFTTVRAAFEAGVTVLCGTDSQPFGNVATEIDWLVRAGLPVEAAVGAGSWVARDFLGVQDSGDLVVYDRDPTEDPAVLRTPGRIVLRGKVVR